MPPPPAAAESPAPPPAARPPPATREPRPPQAPHALAKTRLCTNWVQRGYCRNGDACNFAHGTTDMTQNAQEIKKSKVSREKVSASFLPLQAMVRAPSTKLAAPKPPPANPKPVERAEVVPSAAAFAANEAAAEKLTLGDLVKPSAKAKAAAAADPAAAAAARHRDREIAPR